MHAAPFTIAVVGATRTLMDMGPDPVAEWQETVFPYIVKIVEIDISLNKVPVDVRTGGDTAISQD